MVSFPSTRGPTLRFTGADFLRHRLVLATLSGRTVRVDSIRKDDDTAPGLAPCEVSFIRLVDKITNGSSVEINETGTTLRYRPGTLVGQSMHKLSHDCHPSRPLGYYLEPLLMLAPFCKRPLDITLRGPTHGPSDGNADTLAAVSLPLLRRLTLGTSLNPELVVVRRAAASDPGTYHGGRGGCVIFRCGVLSTKIAPVELIEPGVVKRVRGIAFANKVSPSHISQMVDTVRRLLNRFTPDVYIHTDHANGVDCGAGYGLYLAAESTEGCLLGADWATVDATQTPNSVAEQSVSMLLEQIAYGGCVDVQNSCLALLMCALADCDVSRVRLGRVNSTTVSFMRDLRTFFGITFKIRVDEHLEDASDSDSSEESGRSDPGGRGEENQKQEGTAETLFSKGVVMSCVGIGLTNVARQRF